MDGITNLMDVEIEQTLGVAVGSKCLDGISSNLWEIEKDKEDAVHGVTKSQT